MVADTLLATRVAYYDILLAAQDIVVTGHGGDEVRFLVFPNIAACRAHAGLHESAEVKDVKPGEAIIQEGDISDDLYIIRSGSMIVEKIVGGKPVFLSYLPAGSYVGEMALIDGGQRTATVRAAIKSGESSAIASFEQLVELGRSNKQLDANDQGVVQVVDWLWQYAFDQRASDIHLEPRREQGVIRFRIDGVLHPVYQMPMGVLNAMTARIKLLGRMDVVERRRPQDGRIKTRNPRGDEVEMRISTLPTAFGEKMVMRIFDPDNAVKDLDALGFSAHDAQRWEALVKRPPANSMSDAAASSRWEATCLPFSTTRRASRYTPSGY